MLWRWILSYNANANANDLDAFNISLNLIREHHYLRNDSKFVLYDKIHLYNTVLELKYLPLYKFNRPYSQFNLIKFFE